VIVLKFQIYVYTSMSKIFSEADKAKEQAGLHSGHPEDSLDSILHPFSESEESYFGKPLLYSKFSPSFKTAVAGTILDVDMPDEKWFNSKLLKKKASKPKNKNISVEFFTSVQLQILSHTKIGNLTSIMVDFCPPGYFYGIQVGEKVCYRKKKMEFGLGINRDEDKLSRRKCESLGPLKFLKSKFYNATEYLVLEGYYDRCYDVHFTKDFSLNSDDLEIVHLTKPKEGQEGSHDLEIVGLPNPEFTQGKT
jgi:hypothetical protein